MAGCSPSECDGICWCSLIFLSSQANSSPKPYCQLSTRHTSPSPSPLLGWGACGGSESTSRMAGSHHCYFPFSTLSADVAQAPCLLHLKFGARWELTAQELEASVMPSYSWWVLHWGSKLQCEFTFHYKGTAVICSLEEQCCFTTTEGPCRHKIPQTSGGTAANSASVPIHRAYLLCLPERCCFSAQRIQGWGVWICSRCSHLSWMLLFLKLAWDNQPTPNETISLLGYIKSQTSVKPYNLHPVSRLIKLDTTSLTVVWPES